MCPTLRAKKKADFVDGLIPKTKDIIKKKKNGGLSTPTMG